MPSRLHDTSMRISLYTLLPINRLARRRFVPCMPGPGGLYESCEMLQLLGPYRIAGWSLGGNLADEIATQLLGEDETVTFLGLIDTDNHAGIGLNEPQSLDDNTVLLNIVLQTMDAPMIL